MLAHEGDYRGHAVDRRQHALNSHARFAEGLREFQTFRLIV